jgi:hypothetical protein
VAEDLIGYDTLTQEAMRGVVRAALSRAVGARGLPGRHHFYITFKSQAPGVVLPDHLKQRYPEEMTIVLEHQFWDLEVFPDRFRVILKFGGQPYPIVAPFAALTRFYDPSVRFGLQFDSLAGGMIADDAHEPEATAEQAAPGADTGSAAAGSAATGTAAVVSLDAFRKK